MHIFLTGATGFIGRHVLREVLQDGHTATALVRNGKEKSLNSERGLSILESDIDRLQSHHFEGVDCLVHLAASGVVDGMNDWRACFKTNVTDSLELWKTAENAGVKKMVISGSCFEYGRSAERYKYIPVDAPLEPVGAYHASKAAASMAAIALCVEAELELTILRPFHVFGDGEAESRFWPSLKKSAEAGQDFDMTLGEQVRDFVPVNDVARFFKSAINRKTTPGRPEVYNVGTGKPQKLSEFASYWWTKWAAKGQLNFGAVNYRKNEIMRYVPLVHPSLE